ncbi:neuromodulin-like [Heptranchias perlo]|uniref:neuromodulin-like n=1 Tax=Heptranchias perlo TaxID=212740 RepID=UPI00355A3A48
MESAKQEDRILGFARIAGFPQMQSIIDCTQIALCALVEEPGVHMNMKGFQLLNVQQVCDDMQCNMQVCARFPGRCHGAFKQCQSSISLLFDPSIGPFSQQEFANFLHFEDHVLLCLSTSLQKDGFPVDLESRQVKGSEIGQIHEDCTNIADTIKFDSDNCNEAETYNTCCCLKSTKRVEKNDEANAKAEQETTKPEDKAHKAATKIQASFRGHITRKKLKGEKKGESAVAATAEGAEKKEEAKKTEATKEQEATATEPAASVAEAKTEEAEKVASNSEAPPSDAEKASEAKEAPTENLENATPAATDEKTANGEKDPKETGNAASAATESTPSSNVTSSQEKEKKQVEVPAAEASEAATKAQTETADSSKAPEKTDSADESKSSESAQNEEVKGDENKAPEENA